MAFLCPQSCRCCSWRARCPQDMFLPVAHLGQCLTRLTLSHERLCRCCCLRLLHASHCSISRCPGRLAKSHHESAIVMCLRVSVLTLIPSCLQHGPHLLPVAAARQQRADSGGAAIFGPFWRVVTGAAEPPERISHPARRSQNRPDPGRSGRLWQAARSRDSRAGAAAIALRTGGHISSKLSTTSHAGA